MPCEVIDWKHNLVVDIAFAYIPGEVKKTHGHGYLKKKKSPISPVYSRIGDDEDFDLFRINVRTLPTCIIHTLVADVLYKNFILGFYFLFFFPTKRRIFSPVFPRDKR